MHTELKNNMLRTGILMPPLSQVTEMEERQPQVFFANKIWLVAAAATKPSRPLCPLVKFIV